MKKLLVFALLLVYTTFASGITLQLHYCQGKLKFISLFGKEKENDCCGSKIKKKNCCNNKTSFLKVNDKHNSNPSLIIASCKGKTSQAIFSLQDFKLYPSVKSSCTSYYHAPPVTYHHPLYLKNRVLII
jgi:hypothetical protein